MRPCTVCIHSKVRSINRALGRGEAIMAVARKYGVKHDIIRRHLRKCVPVQVQEAVLTGRVRAGADVVEQLQGLQQVNLGILDQLLADPERPVALQLAATREVRANISLEAELTHRLNRGTTVQVALVQSPEWHRLASRIYAALEPYPEARYAVARALEDSVTTPPALPAGQVMTGDDDDAA